MIKKTNLLLILLFFMQLAVAQEIKFGDITKEELQEKSYELDSSANAAVLYKYRNTYFTILGNSGIEVVTEVQERIKIYNKQGFESATKQIRLFKNGGTRENVGRIKAYTYNLENGEIVKTQLDKDQIFKSEYNKNINEVKFTMPNLKEGSVLEYKYKIISPFYQNIDEFRFQYGIPIKYIEAYIKMPEGLNFKRTQKGYMMFTPKKTQSSISGVDMDKYAYIIKDVPALKEEEYVDNIDNYRSGIMFELVSIDFPGFYRSFAQTWSDVAKTIGNTDDYEKQLDKAKSFSDQLDEIVSATPELKERMKLIFKYVKDNVKWNGNDGKYFQYGIKKALKEKKGNAGDINLMLVAMLRYAGIKANPVVISTKDNAIPFFPTLDRLNYVIAHAEINGKSFVMDAADEFSDIDLLPIRDYNWQGIYIDNNKMVWKQIGIKKPKQAIAQYQVQAKLEEDGSIEGTFRSRYTSHYSYLFKKGVKDQDMDAIITKRENDFKNIEISDYELKNYDSYEGNVSESFTYYQESGGEQINNKIYINPMTFLAMSENPFKPETREFPIDFGYAFKDLYIVNIEIPEGYELESAIEPFLMRTPDGDAEFKYTVKVLNNKIILSANFNIKKAIHSATNYLYLKEFFNQVITKEAEKIVFKKVEP